MERVYVIFNRIIIRGSKIAILVLVLLTILGSLELGVQAKGPADKNELNGNAGIIPPQFSGMKIPNGVKFFENEGQEHVEPGTHVTYKTDPPTSGPHYHKWMPPGVYEAGDVQPELLVHNLEHGNIVIYFDRSAISKADMDELIALQKNYNGQWDGVLLVGRKSKKDPLILTAWRAMMPLKGYDKGNVLEFVDLFRGRGPEKAVR